MFFFLERNYWNARNARWENAHTGSATTKLGKQQTKIRKLEILDFRISNLQFRIQDWYKQN